jgi:hypothetical protein
MLKQDLLQPAARETPPLPEKAARHDFTVTGHAALPLLLQHGRRR